MAKMSKKMMLAKVQKVKELEAQIAQLQAQADELKEALKSAMEQNGTDEMKVDIFTIRYKIVKTSRFDSTAFKATHKELYEQYTKQTESRRFTITA